MTMLAPAPAVRAAEGEQRPAVLSPVVAIGFLLVAGLPALFWAGIAGLAGHVLGFSISATTLMLGGAMVALFLVAIFAAVVIGR